MKWLAEHANIRRALFGLLAAVVGAIADDVVLPGGLADLLDGPPVVQAVE